MNNQILMNNYLIILKGTVEVYVHGTLESSNIEVRELLKYGLDETMDNQAETYDLMTTYGWYSVENIEQSTIKQTLNKIKKS